MYGIDVACLYCVAIENGYTIREDRNVCEVCGVGGVGWDGGTCECDGTGPLSIPVYCVPPVYPPVAAAGYRLQTAACRLQAVGCRFQGDYVPWVVGDCGAALYS